MYGTAELVGLPASYVDENTIFFPHPTSNLSREQVFALIDTKIDEIVNALLARRRTETSHAQEDGIEGIKAALESFRQSLHADGANLTIGDLRDGVLQTKLEVGEGCEGGTCVLPRAQLVAIIRATLRDKFPHVASVQMADSREA